LCTARYRDSPASRAIAYHVISNDDCRDRTTYVYPHNKLDCIQRLHLGTYSDVVPNSYCPGTCRQEVGYNSENCLNCNFDPGLDYHEEVLLVPYDCVL